MNALTIKIPEDLENALTRAAASRGVSRSELVREAIAAYTVRIEEKAHPDSALALAGDLVGCVRNAPSDLATDPRHMQGYGED